jgi:DNA-binding MarR family transcriptional regulator
VVKRLGLPFDPIERAAQIWEERFGPASAMAAATSVMRAQQILLAELDGVLRPRELTFARYEALVLLSFSRHGRLPLRVIGERLMVHPTSVTNTIDRLERQGLVRRRPNPSDGRGKLAEITPKGREVMAAATADLAAAEFGMADYDEGELGQMFTLLRGLRVAAGDFVHVAADEPRAAADEPRAAANEPQVDEPRAAANEPQVDEPEAAADEPQAATEPVTPASAGRRRR